MTNRLKLIRVHVCPLIPITILFVCFSVSQPLAAADPVVRPLSKGLPGFLNAYCMSCHDAAEMSGDVDLASIVHSPDNTESEKLIMLLDVISNGDMPPEGQPQPSSQARKAASLLLHELLLKSAASPGHGNLVDHETLFTEPEIRRAATPARLWRISPHIFMHYANSLTGTEFLRVQRFEGGDDGLHPAFSYMTPAHAFRDSSQVHFFEEATSELLFDVCWQVAGLQLNRHGRKPQTFQSILGSKPPSTSHWSALIRYQFQLAVRRGPNNEELSQLTSLGEKTRHDAGTATAVQTVLAAVLMRPDAVYRFEVGSGIPDELGRVRLSDYELAHAISYALTDLAPDVAMLAAITRGDLSDSHGVLEQVKRLLKDPASDARILRFFREYFEYTRAEEVFKDARRVNQTRPDLRITDADRLIEYILKADRQVLRRLLTEDHVFVVSDGGQANPFFKEVMRELYLPDFGIPSDWDWQENGVQPVKPTTGRRSGILTHPAWLLAFSDNEKNQAIQRGRWIYMKLLGGTIPDTPIGVDAVLPESPTEALRERMQVTRQQYCWRCHQRMDPLGLTLEQYDDFGRWRDEEVGRTVVTTGEIKIGDSALDGVVDGPLEMLDRMARSERVEQVFTRHVFRYFLGRNETPDDAPTLIDAHRAYRESDGSFRALVASLLTSDSFLLRTQAKAEQ